MTMSVDSTPTADFVSADLVAGGVFPAGLVEELLDRVRSEGIELLGEGGLIPELTKRLLERAMDEELTEHLGYERGDPGGRGTGNSRNGTTPKRVLTEVGPVALDVPRDRNATFEPRIVPKGTSRLGRLSENIVAFYAQGMSTRDITRALNVCTGSRCHPI